jgi:hypothetical protein
VRGGTGYDVTVLGILGPTCANDVSWLERVRVVFNVASVFKYTKMWSCYLSLVVASGGTRGLKMMPACGVALKKPANALIRESWMYSSGSGTTSMCERHFGAAAV